MDPRIAVRVRTVQMRRPQTTRWKKEQWNVSSASGMQVRVEPFKRLQYFRHAVECVQTVCGNHAVTGWHRRTGSAISCGPRRPTVCSVRGNHVSTHLRGTVNKVWCRRP